MRISREITLLQKVFGNRDSFTTRQLTAFLKKGRRKTSATAINWKIHSLKEKEMISSLGRGIYRWGETPAKILFAGKLSGAQRALYAKIKTKYPLAKFCIWPVRWLHEFMTHLPTVNWTLIEVEKELSESVFAFLREKRLDVYLNPDASIMEHHIAYDRNAIIVRDLISQAPLIHAKEMASPTIEKVLVDLYVDKVVFDIYQGSELENIFSEACRKYKLNLSRLKRYATRRRAWDVVAKFLRKIDARS